MVSETIYFLEDLTEGICPSCNERTDCIVKSDGRCVDYIEKEKFSDGYETLIMYVLR